MRATGRQAKYVFRLSIKIFFSLCFERQRCSVLVCWCVCLVSDAARDGKIKYRGRTRHGGKQHIWHPPPASLLLCRHRRHPSPSIRPEHKTWRGLQVATCGVPGPGPAQRRGGEQIFCGNLGWSYSEFLWRSLELAENTSVYYRVITISHGWQPASWTETVLLDMSLI